VPKANRAKYCPDCAARVHRRQKTESERKRRFSAALGSCGKGNRLACALWAAVVYMGSLSCVSSILLSVAALSEKASCPISAACSGVGTLPTASGQVVPK